MSLGSDRQTTLADEIRELLAEFRGIHPLKRLFWELLGYDRRDEAIIFSGSPAFRSSVIEARLLASQGSFHVYYVTLIHDVLTRPLIQQIYRYFRKKHLYFALLISDVAQTRWHLAYLADDLISRHPHSRLATMAMGDPEENLHRQAVRLTRLRTYNADDEPVDLLELVAAYDEVFAALRPRKSQEKQVLDDFSHLIHMIGCYPLLSARQERAILVELSQISDTLDIGEDNHPRIIRVPDPDFIDRYEELRSQLVLHNQRLCFHHAKKYSRTHEDLFDLFQEAIIGLLVAIDRFDAGRNVKFSTYAIHWIKQRIRTYFWNHRLIVRLPRHVWDLPKQDRLRFSIESLEGDNHSQPRDIEDCSSHSSSFQMEQDDMVQVIGEALQTLNGRDASIVAMRFGLNGSCPSTLEEIGQELNITKERVRQIESRAMARLRDQLVNLDQNDI